jgi:nicotinamidase-related amidase
MTMLTLTERSVRGYPASEMPTLVERQVSLDPAKTAFLPLHCWNIGFPEGPETPDYWVFMGSKRNNEMCVTVTDTAIAPALQAARAAGVHIVHVQSEKVARRHKRPDVQIATASPPQTVPYEEAVARTERITARVTEVHGAGYMDWHGWDEVDIAASVYPEPDEVVVINGEELDLVLRERGITNLIYTGFATNLCILDSPGAMKEMAAKGYKVMLLREGTLGVEFADTIDDLTNTRMAIRYIEGWAGSSIGLDDFLEACERA